MNKLKEVSTALHAIQKIKKIEMAVFNQIFATGEPRGGAPERSARGCFGGVGAPRAGP